MKQEEDFYANLVGEDGPVEESKTSWFKRIKKGITTSTAEKKETPEGLWAKCPECNSHYGMGTVSWFFYSYHTRLCTGS